jgi:hypothetical protein
MSFRGTKQKKGGGGGGGGCNKSVTPCGSSRILPSQIHSRTDATGKKDTETDRQRAARTRIGRQTSRGIILL